ncbi:DNA modification methylase [Phototrophicus methaneseepsis]|uniref:Methyltransferase n=1 Tax=Phototrophicus methaneseepsis TaxID=2710758 RepID=A0A7S8EBL0_9CHLR|nr:DNA methyltransferase [Phototrophicus methaneseepsis]QPC83768.1 DNA modification methylase [Phototrophicus methaneseepsis]
MTQDVIPAINWRSRIVRTGSIRAGDVKPHPLNPKQHPHKQQQAVSNSLDVLGELKRIVINANNGYLVDGEQRWQIALSQGEDTPLACDWVDLSDDEHELALQILDPLAALSKVDVDRFEQLLANVAEHELVAEGPIFDLLSDLAKESGLSFGEAEAAADAPEAQIDKAEELLEKWQVQPGDVWVIPSTHGGEHRLMCGDSTRETDVQQLITGLTTWLMVTDPPYGIQYDQDWRSHNRTGKVTNDDNADWRAAYALSPADVAYVWHASRFASLVQDGLEAVGFELRAQIIWVKNRAVFSQGHYHWQHEPCWYGVRKGSTANWAGDRTQKTVWAIDGDADAPGNHGTQKPVECMARAIRNHEGHVYDPFGGSGTTMLACEQLGRLCRMMEIEPKYCAVILERMRDMGLSPRLETRQETPEKPDLTSTKDF